MGASVCGLAAKPNLGSKGELLTKRERIIHRTHSTSKPSLYAPPNQKSFAPNGVFVSTASGSDRLGAQAKAHRSRHAVVWDQRASSPGNRLRSAALIGVEAGPSSGRPRYCKALRPVRHLHRRTAR